MPQKPSNYLTKRQQQIMEVIYRSGSADVATVMSLMAQPPTNPALRAHLRTLEEAGYLAHTEENGKFVYHPTQRRQVAARSALSTLLRTFFEDSAEAAMATLLSIKSADIDDQELDRLQEMIETARAAKSRPEARTNTDPAIDA